MCDSNNREVRIHIEDPLNTLYVIKNFILQITLVNMLYFQFFAHPVINTLMSEKWHGELGMKRKQSWLTRERWTWGFLNIWCLFDIVLFPFLFLAFGTYHFVRKKIRNRKGKTSSSKPFSFDSDFDGTRRKVFSDCHKKARLDQDDLTCNPSNFYT